MVAKDVSLDVFSYVCSFSMDCLADYILVHESLSVVKTNSIAYLVLNRRRVFGIPCVLVLCLTMRKARVKKHSILTLLFECTEQLHHLRPEPCITYFESTSSVGYQKARTLLAHLSPWKNLIWDALHLAMLNVQLDQLPVGSADLEVKLSWICTNTLYQKIHFDVCR